MERISDKGLILLKANTIYINNNPKHEPSASSIDIMLRAIPIIVDEILHLRAENERLRDGGKF